MGSPELGIDPLYPQPWTANECGGLGKTWVQRPPESAPLGKCWGWKAHCRNIGRDLPVGILEDFGNFSWQGVKPTFDTCFVRNSGRVIDCGPGCWFKVNLLRVKAREPTCWKRVKSRVAPFSSLLIKKLISWPSFRTEIVIRWPVWSTGHIRQQSQQMTRN
jgi:hypothetical protein